MRKLSYGEVNPCAPQSDGQDVLLWTSMRTSADMWDLAAAAFDSAKGGTVPK